MNYLDYFRPGGTIKVKNLDGTDYGSEIQSTNLRNLYEYLRLTVNKIKKLYELGKRLEEIAPKNTKDTPYSNLWNLFHYINNTSDPLYLSLRGQFRDIDDSNSFTFI